ncbi:hypothetical protein CVD28_11410 [Bacillus sp. M6-12]|nr:hypothetical protein CVD28_11410 [Bacillus sp. M6-12]
MPKPIKVTWEKFFFIMPKKLSLTKFNLSSFWFDMFRKTRDDMPKEHREEPALWNRPDIKPLRNSFSRSWKNPYFHAEKKRMQLHPYDLRI